MAFDFKKEYKEFYMPKNKPEIVTVPKANYIAVRGHGNPNEEGGEYKNAVGVLYAIAYTLKMSYKTDYKIEGFFEYVVPPLEGFWWQDDVDGIDYSSKDTFSWISVIRLPDFVTQKDFDWAKETAEKKKKLDCSSAEFMTIDEGLCVQIMHNGPFDNEPSTVAVMDRFISENGYRNDFSSTRIHHEIYMSDARKVEPEKWKTVIRHPIAKISEQDKYLIVTLRERPDMTRTAAEWFNAKWGIPTEAYLECINDYISGNSEYGWYICLDGNRIIGGLGVIENDFHDRKDLSPNICAVYTEEEYRCQGIAGRLLNYAVEDCRRKGISPVYLFTDHTGFYERYGWEFFCMAQGDGEEEMSRLYIHR